MREEEHAPVEAYESTLSGTAYDDQILPRCQETAYRARDPIARCQAKTTLKSYWHELRDHQEYCKKIAMKTGTHTQVPVHD